MNGHPHSLSFAAFDLYLTAMFTHNSANDQQSQT
jgi:hypothetical protein